MKDHELKLYEYALGTLEGCLRARKISLVQIEEFAFDERFKFGEGQPSGIESSEFKPYFNHLAHKLRIASFKQDKWDKERTEKLCTQLEHIMAKGDLTPMRIAVICGKTVADFQAELAAEDEDAF